MSRSIQQLSQGAADQLYLAVRLAICDMVLPAEKHVPLILDDALVTFDDDRLRAALDYLLSESKTGKFCCSPATIGSGRICRGGKTSASSACDLAKRCGTWYTIYK